MSWRSEKPGRPRGDPGSLLPCHRPWLRAVSNQVLRVRDEYGGGGRRDSLPGLTLHLVDERLIGVGRAVAGALVARGEGLVQLIQQTRVDRGIADGAAGPALIHVVNHALRGHDNVEGDGS